jgi:uncharacterized membrane protein
MNWSFFSEPVVQLILATAALMILAVVGIYVLQKLKGQTHGQAEQPPDWLAEFRQLREKGVITEEEYQAIRENLAGQLRRRTAGDSEDSG